MKSNNNDKNAALITALLPVVVIIIILVVMQKFISGISNIGQGTGEGLGLGDKIGIFKDEIQKATERKVKSFLKYLNDNPDKNYFTDNYFQKVYQAPKTAGKAGRPLGKLTAADAEGLVNNIKDSDGYIIYKPEQLVNCFQFCKAKVEIAYVAHVWKQKGYGDLFTFIKNYTGPARKESALQQIFDYTNALPIGRK